MDEAESYVLTLSVMIGTRVRHTSTRTWMVETHDKEHVQPVTATRGEEYFPTIGASFLFMIAWIAVTSSLRYI